MTALKITFAGAARTVTGSKYLVESGGKRVLVDAGIYQGLKELRLRNWEEPPFDPASLDAVLLTHAHIDHTGYLPRLVTQGFSGPVYCHKATADLCEILWPDSGHLQEEHARYANKEGFSKHAPALPLYTEADARLALRQLRGVNFDQPVEVTSGISATWRIAGHILGASMIRLEADGKSVLFSGDLGTVVDEILPSPVAPEPVDALLVESTYGDRTHGDERPDVELARVVNETADRRGVLLIPAFAVGRTQEILYTLRELEAAERVPELPVAVNSPMAVDVTGIYRRHPAAHNMESRHLLETGQRPFSTKNVRFCRSVQESKSLSRVKGPAIIISASGMMTGGRILHHLVNRLPDERNTVLLVGYQAAGSRGRQILEGAETIKIFGQQHPVRAKIERINGFSAHADRDGLLGWLGRFDQPPAQTFVVHGEEGPSQAIADALTERGWKAHAPDYLETAEIG